MNEKIGYKTKSLTVLNILFIIMILLTLGLFIIIDLIDLEKPTGVLLALIFLAWIYLPYREIKQDKKRYEVVIEMDKNSIQLRDLKNDLSRINIKDISQIKVAKFPFIKFGTITFYTQLEKVSCRYIKDVTKVAANINERIK